MTKPNDDTIHRLRDIEVEEVSVVDRAANKRKFLVVKRGENMGAEVTKTSDGSMTTRTPIKMRTEWREALVETAADALERLATIVETAKSAVECDDDDLTFPTDIAGEITSIAEAISDLPVMFSKQMTTAQINDLPDAAFAIVKPGGSKDDDGKTVPRSLRVFPHHRSNVKDPSEHSSLDVPHLRNALARLSQADLTAEERAKVKAHLEAHADAVLASRGGDPSLVKGNESTSKADDDDGRTDIDKAHWMSTFKELFDQLKTVVEDAKRAPQDAPNTRGPNVGSGVQPDPDATARADQFFAEIPGLKDLMKSIQGMTETVQTLSKSIGDIKTDVSKQASKISKLETGIDEPASRQPDRTETAKGDDGVTWPLDMNRKERGDP